MEASLIFICCHSGAGGGAVSTTKLANPVTLLSVKTFKSLDPRLRGDDGIWILLT